MSCKRLSLSNKAYISNTAIFLHGKSHNVWSSISTSSSSSSSSSLHQNWLVPSFSAELLSMPGFRRTWGALCSLVCNASFVGSSSGDNNIEPCTKVSQTRNFQLRSQLQLLCLILCDLHLAILPSNLLHGNLFHKCISLVQRRFRDLNSFLRPRRLLLSS